MIQGSIRKEALRNNQLTNVGNTCMKKPDGSGTVTFHDRIRGTDTTFTPSATATQSEVNVTSNVGSFTYDYQTTKSLTYAPAVIYGVAHYEVGNTTMRGNIVSITQQSDGGVGFMRVVIEDPGDRVCRLISCPYTTISDYTGAFVAVSQEIRITNRNVFDIHFFESLTTTIIPRAFNICVLITPDT